MSRNLLTRIAVAAVTIPIILTVCYTGGAWFAGMIALFALVATLEFLINEKYGPSQFHFWFLLLTVVACFATAHRAILSGNKMQPGISLSLPSFLGFLPIIMAFFMITTMIGAMGRKSPGDLFTSNARLVWGVIYLGCLYPCVLALGADDSLTYLIAPSSHGDLLLFLFGLLWIGDTCAMGFGKWIGKHKLAPTVSPNKTIEGFIGGIIGAIAVGILMHYWKFPQLGFGHIMAISIGCSIFGQLGDLVESMWKRSLGIKDSSTIIPGHGGVLDRFDSLLFAAPFMYAYLSLLPRV